MRAQAIGGGLAAQGRITCRLRVRVGANKIAEEKDIATAAKLTADIALVFTDWEIAYGCLEGHAEHNVLG